MPQGMDEEQMRFDHFVKTIQFDELCAIAANHRGGIPCQMGNYIIGGFNVVYEMIFSDDVIWMARIPLPYNCFQPEEVSASYAATLKYVKEHSSIPVPTVFGYQLHSDPKNKVNVTYVLMEQIQGHALPVLEQKGLEPDPKDLELARKVHRQLTDLILELATMEFDKVGSLQEDPSGNFFVAPYIDPVGTAYPEQKAVTYKSLDPCSKGPFSSVSAWYKAMAELNRNSALDDPEEEDRIETVGDYELLAELTDHIAIEQFENGPFVINHNDLTLQNILVDDEFNITGVLDFPGTIVPLASLCVFPWMFNDDLDGLVVEREAYLDIFLNQECRYPSSALRSCELRRQLMESAQRRQRYELGLLGPYAFINLPLLFEEIYNRSLDRNTEYKNLASRHPWFKKLVNQQRVASDH